MLLALLAAAAAQPEPSRPKLVVQATATVRIVNGQQIRLGEARPDAQLRHTQLRETDGSVRQARLVEFQ